MSSQFGLSAAWFGSADEESDALSVQEHFEEPSNHHRWTYQASAEPTPSPWRARCLESRASRIATRRAPAQQHYIWLVLQATNCKG